MKSFLLKSEDITKRLRQRYKQKHKQWLSGIDDWPLSFPLGLPTEKKAFDYLSDVQQWQNHWFNWKGEGEIIWIERHWSKLGKQKLPEKIKFHEPIQIIRLIGEEENWIKIANRYQNLIKRWPNLSSILLKYFKILEEYDEVDFNRLFSTLEWFSKNPNSDLYIRQLPIEGVHTKWLLSKKSIVGELVKTINERDKNNFYLITGLRQEPTMIRIKILDKKLREYVGGIGDLSISLDNLKNLSLSVKRIYIIENLQTGLAFNDIPDSIVIMGLGYSIDILQDIKLLNNVTILYWGDIDTDGFAILNRLRKYFPHAQSLLMDEVTLLEHKKLWGKDDKPKNSNDLSMLTKEEKKLYDDISSNRWVKNLRLEQEHISWLYAWEKLLKL